MATIAASPADRKASERKFYTRMALFLVLLVLLGFSPSFYLRGIVPPYPRPNPTLPPAVLLHGSVFTLWMLAIVTQTQLIAARKHEIHMRLGKLGMLFLAKPEQHVLVFVLVFPEFRIAANRRKAEFR